MHFLRRSSLVACCVVIALLTAACTPWEIHLAKESLKPHTSVSSSSSAVSEIAKVTKPTGVKHPTPAEQIWYAEVEKQKWYAAAFPPTRWGAPAPWSSERCPAGPIKDEIDLVFSIAAPWAESIAMRESTCQNWPRNPSGASGLFQLLGHQDILAAVCPSQSTSTSWWDYKCNAWAAYKLFASSGTAPWRF